MECNLKKSQPIVTIFIEKGDAPETEKTETSEPVESTSEVVEEIAEEVTTVEEVATETVESAEVVEVVEEPVSRNKDDLASFLIMWLLLLGSAN